MASMKLTITAFSDPGYDRPLQSQGTYVAQINPEAFSHGHSVEYNPASSTDTAGATTKYNTIKPETLSFSFYLDGTGVVSDLGPAAAATVPLAVARFKQVAYRYNGEIHSPNYLLLVWGGFLFKCRLTGLDVEYVLFDSLGIPLRAKLTPRFEQFLDPSDLAKLSARSSPDMTHVRVAAPDDSLPLMCHRIYGDSCYYLWVADYNGLTDFRNLRPGQTIAFPPLPGDER
jgi:nucleoid-associated protein YgaU